MKHPGGQQQPELTCQRYTPLAQDQSRDTGRLGSGRRPDGTGPEVLPGPRLAMHIGWSHGARSDEQVAVVVVQLGDERGDRCGDRFPNRVPVAEAPRCVTGLRQCDGCPRWAADLIRNASSPRALPEAN